LLGDRSKSRRYLGREVFILRSSALRRLIGSLAVDQPAYAEAIDEHPKTRGPERFLERHYHSPVLRQVVKDPFSVSRARDLKRQRACSALPDESVLRLKNRTNTLALCVSPAHVCTSPMEPSLRVTFEPSAD
jgi:hypothetical protein